MVRAFTQNLAQLNAQKGGRFSLFDGNVSGEFTDLVRYRYKYLLRFLRLKSQITSAIRKSFNKTINNAHNKSTTQKHCLGKRV